MLSVPCPNCRKLLQVVDTSTDRESQCPACGTVFRPGEQWGEEQPTAKQSPSMHFTADLVDEFDLPWVPPPTRDESAESPQRYPSIRRLALVGFAVGVTIGFGLWFRLWHGPEDIFIIAVLGITGAFYFAVYGLLYSVAPDRWHRGSCIAAALVVLGAFLLLPVIVLTHSDIRDRHLGVLLYAAWILFFPGLVLYLMLAILGRVCSSLPGIVDGLSKAAGRPTRLRAPGRRGRVYADENEEDFS